jgi:hypothetical protein
MRRNYWLEALALVNAGAVLYISSLGIIQGGIVYLLLRVGSADDNQQSGLKHSEIILHHKTNTNLPFETTSISCEWLNSIAISSGGGDPSLRDIC